MCDIDTSTPVGPAFRDKLRFIYNRNKPKKIRPDQVVVRYCRNVRCVSPSCMRAVVPAPRKLYPLDLLQAMIEDYIMTEGLEKPPSRTFINFYKDLFQDVQKDYWLDVGNVTKSATTTKPGQSTIEYTLNKFTGRVINNAAVTAEFGY